MKKIIWLFFIIVLGAGLQAQSYQGAIATTDFVTSLTVTMPDGSTPVPDLTICQIMLPGVNGVIDPPNPDGTPGGDDQLVTGIPGNNYYQFVWDSSWTGVTGQLYTPTPFLWNAAGQGFEPTANVGDNIYLRLFDATTVAGASNYLNSALFLLPAALGDLYFNTTAHWDYDSNFNWQSIIPAPTNPDPAQNPTPTDLAVDVPIDTNLSWEYNGTTTPDGYKLFLGTDNPPTNMVNGTDLGAVLTYDPASDFGYSTLYYWQIVPYTSDGDRTAGRDRVARTKKTEISRGDAQNCPIWSFTTEAEPFVAPAVFISEYIEGSGYNKAIEIYNGTGLAIDLSAFSLEKDVNGNGIWGNTYTYSGTLQADDVFVLANTGADPAILAVADATNNGVINYNGNDQVRLLYNGVEIDHFGLPGGDDFAINVTMVRNADISLPNTTWTLSEWTEYPTNTFDYLGVHPGMLILNPALATLVAPADGAVVPLGNLLLDWDYTGPAVTGFEVWLGYISTDAATWIADVPAGTTAYTVTINEEATDFEWKIYPYIEESVNRGNLFSRTKNKASRGNRERIYPLDAPVIWYFSSFNPTPQPPLPIPPAGGTANLNGGTTGNGGSGAGASITMTPTGTPPTGQIDISQTTPGNLGVPFPDNALDIAFIISTTGTISDPITIKIEWDYPVPTAPTSGAPILLVNHGSGWVYHAVDSWDFSAPAYWIQFTTTELSDWVIGDGDDNPLPVTLSSFSGICVEGVPSLNWTTQSETDNLGWNIYRSGYENGWNDNNVLQLNSSIIAGMGTTSQITNYNFQDTEPVIDGQTYYYWLQNVSLSGELAHFGPVTVLVELEDEPIIIPDLPVSTSLNANYPNPFNPTTIIKFDIKEGESGKFTIYNLLGQKVVEQNFEAGYHTFHWNANNQSSGVYFYTLRTPSYLNTKKMILMK